MPCEDLEDPLQYLLLYGSQTGQAKAIAEEISEKSIQHGLKANLFCMSEVDKKFDFDKEENVVMVLSTTGDGEPPDTALKLWRRLKKKTLPKDHLSHIKYSLLGLGDSNYTSFCQCPKMFDRRLKNLGAKVFHPVVMADDAVGLDVAADPWMESLFPALKKIILSRTNLDEKNDDGCNEKNMKIETTELKNDSSVNCDKSIVISQSLIESTVKELDNIHISEISNTERINSSSIEGQQIESLTVSSAPLCDTLLSYPMLMFEFLKIEYLDEDIDLTSLPHQNGYNLPSSNSKLMNVGLQSAKVLTTEDAVKKALLIKLDVSGTDFVYHPGDSFGVVCPNSHNEVMSLIQRMNLMEKANTTCFLSVDENTKKPGARLLNHLFPKATLYHLLSTCVDIRTTPKKAFLRTLSEYTQDEKEKRRLLELCSKQGAEQFTKYIREPSITVLDILKNFISCHPPITILLEQLPRLQPRIYSCASCSLHEPNSVDFVFNVVNIPYGSGRTYTRNGVCTGWLDEMTDSMQTLSDDSGNAMKIPIYLRSNQHFRLPENFKDPIIMIGPGTGVAPFIGFLQQRQNERITHSVEELGECILFFGCRNKEKDYLFREELDNFLEKKTLSELYVSFSRDEDTGNGVKYVQDNINTQGEQIVNLICDKNAFVYVCGDANNMAKDVMKAFSTILQAHKGMTPSNADNYLKQMKLVRRYKEDVWT